MTRWRRKWIASQKRLPRKGRMWLSPGSLLFGVMLFQFALRSLSGEAAESKAPYQAPGMKPNPLDFSDCRDVDSRLSLISLTLQSLDFQSELPNFEPQFESLPEDKQQERPHGSEPGAPVYAAQERYERLPHGNSHLLELSRPG